MFQSARLKLTIWYVIIIMCISIAFSTVIYAFLSREVERFARVQRVRIERQRSPFTIIPPPELQNIIYDPDLIEETKHRILYILIIINGSIIAATGGLGYILAGRTLRPIKEMVEEQHRFIQDASHELRTPLTSLKSSLEVSLRDKKATLNELKQTIREGILDTNKLQSLTDALLQLAQYEKPGHHIPKTIINVHDVIAKAVESVESIAKKKTITIKYPTGDVIVKGNQNSLTEACVILLENAIKYSPNKSTITIGLHATDKIIKISIADQGIGIEQKDIPYIFDRFYRADSARTNNDTSGYGLGLSIAKHLIEIHNGSIEVKSTARKGSTFTIIVPV